MHRMPVVNCSSDASGAWQAGSQGHVVVVVDIIDMSTTLEAALEAGALRVYGASPKEVKVPVPVNPNRIGLEAGQMSRKLGVPIIIVAEPRWGNDDARIQACDPVIMGIQQSGIKDYTIVPNLGISTTKLVDFQDTVVVAVTNSGGVAFDAALAAGGLGLSATVARTWKSKGLGPAKQGVERALSLARKLQKNITFVAASSQSLEDVLAAQFLTQLALTNRI